MLIRPLFGGALAALAMAIAPAAPALAQSTDTQRVRLPYPAYDGTLTPYTFSLGYPLVTLVYDTIMWRDEQGVPQPWLARSIARSADGRRVTIRLRDGVRWHDGRPLTAADVAFTFDYVAARYHPRFTPQLENIGRVRVTDRLTVRFDLRRPSLGFDDQPLSDVPILPRHLWRDLPAGRRVPAGMAVGSGPYRLVSVDRRAGYVLRADDGYFRGAPQVEEIRVPLIGDANAQAQALRDRDVDMVPLSLPRRTARIIDSTVGLAVRRGPAYSGTALVLNTLRAPFDDLEVRKAVASALDLDRIARNVEPAVPAEEGFVHPASRWSPGSALHRFEPLRARPVLGRLERPIRVLAPNNDPVRLQAGRQVVLALNQAGADATLVELSRAQLDRATGAATSEADFEAAIQSTPALASHDPDYLKRLFGSDPASAPLNIGAYHSDEFDALARRVASAPDAAARQRATTAELKLLADEAPSIPLFFSQGTFGLRPAIYNGWTFVKGDGILDKRSFLSGARPAASVVEETELAEEALTGSDGDDGGGGVDAVNVISIIVLVIVVVLAITALVARRRARER